MTAPSVSVVIPTYNGETHIRATLRSVVKQSYTDFEVVVVDDGSTDHTWRVVAEFCESDGRIRGVRNETHSGAEATWNSCLREARGRYVKLLPQDDLIHPACLAEQVSAMESSPRAVMVSSCRSVIDETGKVLLARRGLQGFGELVEGREAIRSVVRAGTNLIGEPGAVLMRSDAIRIAGEFSARWPYVIDLDYWLRLLVHGWMVTTDRTLAAFRVSRGSWSRQLVKEQRRHVIELLEDVRRRHPDWVSASDLAVGKFRARAITVGRISLYAMLERGLLLRSRPRLDWCDSDGL